MAVSETEIVTAGIIEYCGFNGLPFVKKLPDGRYAAVVPFLFTHAIAVDINEDGTFRNRYCYAAESTPVESVKEYLDGWDGKGHPPGPWIKRKGIDGELLNPDFCRS